MKMIAEVSRVRENNILTHPWSRFLFTSALHGDKIHFTGITSKWPRCVGSCASRMDGADTDVPQFGGELCRVGVCPISAPEHLCPLAGEAESQADMSCSLWKLLILLGKLI